MGRTIIIGDVHGMLVELETLLSNINITKEDVLISAGDLLDKGPDSVGVVRKMRSLREQGYNVILVKGNHEEKHERFRRAVKEDPKRLESFKDMEKLQAISAGLSDEDVAFLDTAVLFHKIPEHDALVVHAGVLPTTVIPDSLSDPLTPKARKRLERICRVRMVDPVGSMVCLGQETEEDVFWADLYDGRYGHVYFGHTPYNLARSPIKFPYATGLDLGCVFGGHLAAAILSEGPVCYVTVKATRSYATALFLE